MLCPECGYENEDNARQCSFCGATITEEALALNREEQRLIRRQELMIFIGTAVLFLSTLSEVLLYKFIWSNDILSDLSDIEYNLMLTFFFGLTFLVAVTVSTMGFFIKRKSLKTVCIVLGAALALFMVYNWVRYMNLLNF